VAGQRRAPGAQDHATVGRRPTRLVARGSSEQEALLVPKVALACFQTAYERWVRDPGQDLPALVDESFAALSGLTG